VEFFQKLQRIGVAIGDLILDLSVVKDLIFTGPVLSEIRPDEHPFAQVQYFIAFFNL
jgi:hypothetical protein